MIVQQDATIYSLLYFCKLLYMFRVSNLSTMAEGTRDGLTSARCRNYSYMCSWWWVELPHEICRAVYRNIIKFIKKNPTRCNNVSNFFIPYLYEAQHVSCDTPLIIRSLKLHWQPLVFHTWKVVGRVVATAYKNFISYLYEARHVSGDTPPIIRSLKLHWQPLGFHTWKVVWMSNNLSPMKNQRLPMKF